MSCYIIFPPNTDRLPQYLRQHTCTDMYTYINTIHINTLKHTHEHMCKHTQTHQRWPPDQGNYQKTWWPLRCSVTTPPSILLFLHISYFMIIYHIIILYKGWPWPATRGLSGHYAVRPQRLRQLATHSWLTTTHTGTHTHTYVSPHNQTFTHVPTHT